MEYLEFKEYLERNTNGYKTFIKKAFELETKKNMKRPPAKRWNEARVNKAVESLWNTVVKNAYEQIKAKKGVPKLNGYQIWIGFMDEIAFVEMFDEGMADLELE